jgi:colicin import membrane protein
MIQRQDRSSDLPFEPPRERGMWRSLTLALVMHGLLLLLLLHGIDWQNSTPAGAEAELWTPDETVDQVQPTPAPPPPPQAVTPPPQTDDAEIAIQQAKQRREDAQRQADLAEQERQKQLQKEADERLQQEHAAQAKLDLQKADLQKKVEQQQKALTEQQLKDQQLKDQQTKEQQAKDADKKAADEALKAKQAAAAQAKAKLDQSRQARLNALKGMAGTSPSGEGLAAAGSGTGSGGNGSAGYADKVRHRVLPNVSFGGNIDANPEAVVTVNCAPDGTVLEAHITKPSNNPAWDSAVLNAVQASSPMPRDKDGTAPHSFTITFKPKS